MSLKEDISSPYTKHNLQFTTAERERFERECGFTDEELEIFRLRARGFSVIKIMFELERLHGVEGRYCVSSVEKRIRKIKNKILRIL